MHVAKKLQGTTVFVGCGFAAKYLDGGGNFSVPLQWVLGLIRLGIDVVWLELFPATNDPQSDRRHIDSFQAHVKAHGLTNKACLLYQKPVHEVQDLEKMACFGLSKKELIQRLKGESILLNLSHSIHPPFIHQFSHRIFCDLDPAEMTYWMSQMEMGQSYHHQFWTVGQNLRGQDCRCKKTDVPWKTFYPLVDTELYQSVPKPESNRFTTIGQWYWLRGIEIDGEYPDLSKKAAFEKYIKLPEMVPEVAMELAVNLTDDDPENERLESFGWRLIHPHQVAATPASYRKYIAESAAEFTSCKLIDPLWRTGWISDRAAAFLATGRPVITEDTGASQYLPESSGIFTVSNIDEAAETIRKIDKDWDHISVRARKSAVDLFDSAKTLEKILASV